MFDSFLNFWKHRDLRARILITIFLLIIVRLLAFVPLPLIQPTALKQLLSQNDFLGFLNLFSGGGLENFSVVTMGVSPFITASIIVQLLGIVIPALEELQKEGEYGQRKLNQYTRLLALPFGIIQAYGVLLLLRQNGVLPTWTPATLVATLVMMSAGSLFLMWLGEIITERGIGNGLSLIITLGILGNMPLQLQSLITSLQTGGGINKLALLGAVFLISIVLVIIINEAKRLVPVSYARKQRYSSGNFGSVASYLPVKINTAGVIPIIFAIALLTMPAFLGSLLSHARTPWVAHAATWLNTHFQPATLAYNITYFILIFGFTYFYTFIVFKPEQVAENLQKQSGFIPGVRPGNETAQFMKTILNRITLLGALFLAFIALLPAFLRAEFPSSTILLSGTSLLIVVSVILETGRQIQSQYLMRTYDAYSHYN
jgi:preprotein translocase subunit SecY